MSGAEVRQLTLFFCQEADSGSDGRLNAHGIYNELYAKGFPAKQDRIVLAGFIEWEREGEGEQPFTIHLTDPDGKPIFTIEGRTVIEPRAPDRVPAKTHLIFPLDNLVFVRQGEYEVLLEIAGAHFRGPILYLLDAEGAE